jgi:hypothetical protein
VLNRAKTPGPATERRGTSPLGVRCVKTAHPGFRVYRASAPNLKLQTENLKLSLPPPFASFGFQISNSEFAIAKALAPNPRAISQPAFRTPRSEFRIQDAPRPTRRASSLIPIHLSKNASRQRISLPFPPRAPRTSAQASLDLGLRTLDSSVSLPPSPTPTFSTTLRFTSILNWKKTGLKLSPILVTRAIRGNPRRSEAASGRTRIAQGNAHTLASPSLL